MQGQLELWPMERQSAAIVPQWETIDEEGQAALIAALARVMIKAVSPNPLSSDFREALFG